MIAATEHYQKNQFHKYQYYQSTLGSQTGQLLVKVKVLSQSQPSWLTLLAESPRRLAKFLYPENSHDTT